MNKRTFIIITDDAILLTEFNWARRQWPTNSRHFEYQKLRNKGKITLQPTLSLQTKSVWRGHMFTYSKITFFAKPETKGIFLKRIRREPANWFNDSQRISSGLTSLGCGHLTSETCFFSQEYAHFGAHTTQLCIVFLSSFQKKFWIHAFFSRFWIHGW